MRFEFIIRFLDGDDKEVNITESFDFIPRKEHPLELLVRLKTCFNTLTRKLVDRIF